MVERGERASQGERDAVLGPSVRGASRPATGAGTRLAPRARTETRPATARPPLHRVLLHNDDFTPRGFVVAVLAAVFRMGRGEAEAVMLAAHTKGCCVVAVYTADVAETKAGQATELGRREGYPLMFTTEPED
jgi:ATP-dependent Clp protease adaptor protein ClpS